MQFLLILSLVYVIWPFYLSALCRRKLLRSWKSKATILYVAVTYAVFAGALPTMILYGSGLQTDSWGGSPRRAWLLIWSCTIALRVYDILHYQLVRIGYDSWRGHNDPHAYPPRSFFGKPK